jgi:conjugal transfer ATP-binding protein TraC
MRVLPFRREAKRPSNPATVAAAEAVEQALDDGSRQVVDLIAPAVVETRRDHLRLERQYVRTLAITGVPRTVSPGWLAPLVELDVPAEISMHITPLDSGQTVRRFTMRLAQLHSSRALAMHKGRVSDPELDIAAADVERLRDLVQRGHEKLFSVSLYIALRAPSRAGLDEVTRRVEATLASMLASCRVLYYEQDTGFQSVMPQGRDECRRVRTLDTTSMAFSFPFVVNSVSTSHGVLIGRDRTGHLPILLDPFHPELENANIAILAPAGSGKSFAAKLLFLRSLLTGTHVLVIDPEGEASRLCAAVGGQRIRLGAGSHERLNPLDLPAAPADVAGDPEAASPVREQASSVVGLMDVMLGTPAEPLGPDARAVIDSAIRSTYAAAGIYDNRPETWSRPAPLLADLRATLETMQSSFGNLAARLALRLQPYTEGNLSGLFRGPTTARLGSHLTVFDTSDIKNEQQQALTTYLVSQWVWGRIRQERRPRLLVVDEAWNLLRTPEGGSFLTGVVRRARKHWLGVVTISQSVSEFLRSPHGQTILGNSAVRLLLRQAPAGIEDVVQTFDLTEVDRATLLAAGKGEGLLFVRGQRVYVQIEASPAEYPLITTAPREVAAIEAEEARAEAARSDTARRNGPPPLLNDYR